MGRPADEPDPGRPRGQGPALPVHRRDARAHDPRGGPAPPARIPGRGGGPGPLVAPAGCWRSSPRGRSAAPRPGRPGAVRGDAHGASVHRGIDARTRRFETVLELRRQRIAFTADLLGEAVISEAEADAYQQTCLDLIRGLAGPLAAEPEIPQIDRDDRGPIPRANLSLKLTSLTARFDALHAETTPERVAAPAPADPAHARASWAPTSTSTWSSTPTRT